MLQNRSEVKYRNYFSFVSNETLIWVLIFGFLQFSSTSASASQNIVVHPLKSAPVLDGINKEWSKNQFSKVSLAPVENPSVIKVRSLKIAAGHHDDNIYLFLEWDDNEASLEHKPYVWSEEKKRYTKGPQREDRLAIQFAMEGDYSSDWRSVQYFKADMWHWKSVRSNPLNLIHDKMTIVGRKKVSRANIIKSHDNKTIYIQRPSDSGDRLYRTKRYHAFQKPVMPKYILSENPKGSIADVQAKGLWRNGKWHLEIKRKFNTGNADDVVFSVGKAVLGGIAVFNSSDDRDHVISKTLKFVF